MSGQEAAGEPGLNAAAIVAALNRHQVRYVVTVAFTAIAPQPGWCRPIYWTPSRWAAGRTRRARPLGDHEPGTFRGTRASVKDCMVWVDSCAPTFRTLIVTGSPV